MYSNNFRSSSFSSRMTDFVVLSMSFVMFALLTESTSFVQMMINMVCYVGIVFVCLRLAKRIVFQYVQNATRVINVLIGNIAGLIVGGALVLSIGYIVPGIAESALVVVFSSVMAFFILGTLSPMVRSSKSDILYH